MTKNHGIPAPEIPIGTEGGVMKHSRLKSRGFTWPYAQARHLEKQKKRAISLATCNPDYQIQHPNETRDNPDKKLLACCHPEASKRLEKEHEFNMRKQAIPVTITPSRYNRIG